MRTIAAVPLRLERGLPSRCHAGREVRQGRFIEQCALRQVDSKGRPQPGHHLRGPQRGAPELEKVIIDANSFYPEDLGPDGRNGSPRWQSAGRRTDALVRG